MRRRIVAGNWKLHGDRAFAHALLDELVAGGAPGDVELVVLPPLPYLSGLVAEYGERIEFGAHIVEQFQVLAPKCARAMKPLIGAPLRQSAEFRVVCKQRDQRFGISAPFEHLQP